MHLFQFSIHINSQPCILNDRLWRVDQLPNPTNTNVTTQSRICRFPPFSPSNHSPTMQYRRRGTCMIFPATRLNRLAFGVAEIIKGGRSERQTELPLESWRLLQ